MTAQWVYNILDKKSEVERILFEDPDPVSGFILLPDMKWDERQVDDLYLVALVNDRSLHSLRDLRSTHVQLMRNIQQQTAVSAFDTHAPIATLASSNHHTTPSISEGIENLF